VEHWKPDDIALAVHWWLTYPPLGRRGAIGWMLEHYGREAIVAELARRLEGAGPNVISIAAARDWPRLQQHTRWLRAM
jgi:hypothetical protein